MCEGVILGTHTHTGALQRRTELMVAQMESVVCGLDRRDWKRSYLSER